MVIPGFTLVRTDRGTQSGRRKGGGLAIFVNSKWCNTKHVTVGERICTRDIELLALGLRPYYLPREFSHVVAVYVPPSAVDARTCDIHSTVAELQTKHPRAFIEINRDFNHVSISKIRGLYNKGE